MEKWLKHCRIYGYADDTTTSCHGKNLGEIIKNLREDAEQILKYMASNGLVANPNKTVFMLLNYTCNEMELELTNEIKIGDSFIKRSEETNLLGVNM